MPRAARPRARRTSFTRLSVVLKEVRETCVWLRLIVKAELLPGHRMTEQLDEGEPLSKIVGQSLVTAKKNQGRL